MEQENITYKYNFPLRFLHWLMAFMLIGMIISGYIMVDLDAKVSPYKWDMYGLHKSFGVCFLILSIVRILVRLKSYSPPYEHEFPKYIKLMSSIVQKSFYFFFFAIPISGMLSSFIGGYGLAVFGYKLPNIFPIDKPFASNLHYMHSKLPYIVIIFILLHIAGVIKHRYFDKKDIFGRMW